MPNAKIADFETAISVAGTGKFQYLLILAIIPASWASSLDTGNISMILASAECDLELSLFDKGLLNAIVYVGKCNAAFEIIFNIHIISSISIQAKLFQMILKYYTKCLRSPVHPFLSKTKHFRGKCFRQKLYSFEGNIKTT